jgi:erythromycin esterase
MLAALLFAAHVRAVVPRTDTPPAQWLAQHAIVLRSTEPTADESDLAPLHPLVADARVVALGDATHGTHEFFSLKQRLVPYLIEHEGFRTVAFEVPYEFDQLDRFVKTGEGDPAAALRIDDYFFWDTQEVLDLILWIRAWNAAGHPAVTVAGIDAIHPAAPTAAVVSYLQGVDPKGAETATTRYNCLNEYWSGNSYLLYDATYHTQCREGVLAVRSEMEAHRDSYERASSHDALEIALHAARVAEQSEESFATSRLNRDAAMGENILWHAGRAKTIVLGHMEHFGRLTYDFIDPRGLKAAGAYATDALGSAYVPIASTTLTGRVTMLAGTPGHYSVGIGDIAPAPPGDVAEILSRAGIPAMIVPLRYVPVWLSGDQAWRVAGTLSRPMIGVQGNLAAGWDAIVYVGSTSATRLLATPYQ